CPEWPDAFTPCRPSAVDFDIEHLAPFGGYPGICDKFAKKEPSRKAKSANCRARIQVFGSSRRDVTEYRQAYGPDDRSCYFFLLADFVERALRAAGFALLLARTGADLVARLALTVLAARLELAVLVDRLAGAVLVERLAVAVLVERFALEVFDAEADVFVVLFFAGLFFVALAFVAF